MAFRFVIFLAITAGIHSSKVLSPVCALEPETGTCKSKLKRFYYDETDGKCKEFWYGGCKGNGNNFETAKQCSAACEPDVVCPTDIKKCSDGTILRREASNNCDFFMCPSYKAHACDNCVRYFDGCNECVCPVQGGETSCTKKTCKGRRGKREKCLKCKKGYIVNKKTGICESDDDDVVCSSDVKKCGDGSFVSRDPDNNCAFEKCPACLLDVDAGKCKGKKKRYYYDAKANKCKKFTYGGCGGNGNRFMSRRKCHNECKHHAARKKKI